MLSCPRPHCGRVGRMLCAPPSPAPIHTALGLRGPPSSHTCPVPCSQGHSNSHDFPNLDGPSWAPEQEDKPRPRSCPGDQSPFPSHRCACLIPRCSTAPGQASSRQTLTWCVVLPDRLCPPRTCALGPWAHLISHRFSCPAPPQTWAGLSLLPHRFPPSRLREAESAISINTTLPPGQELSFSVWVLSP